MSLKVDDRFASSLAFAEGRIVKKKDKSDAVAKMELAIKAAKRALIDFQQGNLPSFDALVGENACELRAACVLDLWEQKKDLDPEVEAALAQLSAAEASLEDLKKQEEIFSKKEEFPDLHAFCAQYKLDVPLSERMLFLAQAFMLCVTSEKGLRTKPSALKAFSPALSDALCKKLVSKAQKSLSAFSVHYLQAEASQLKPRLQCLVQNPFVLTDVQGRCATPCFFGLEVVFHRLWQKKQPILFKVISKNDEAPLFFLFQPGESPLSYVPVSLDQAAPDTAAMVFEGTSSSSKPQELLPVLNRLTPYGIFMMNNAQHPQYFGSAKRSQIAWDRIDDPAIKKAAKSAFYIWNAFALGGCSANNKSFFLIEHSFCDLIGNQCKEVVSECI